MAIQKQIIEERFNMTVADAYVKLAYVEWDDINNTLWAHFSTWATPTSEAEGKECISMLRIDASSVYPTLQADLYAFAKSTPALSGGVDV